MGKAKKEKSGKKKREASAPYGAPKASILDDEINAALAASGQELSSVEVVSGVSQCSLF
jgi:hypothetical protein